MKPFFITVFIILLFIIIHQYTGWEVTDLFPPKAVAVHPVSTAELDAGVHLVNIEDKIYRNSPKSPSSWVAPLYRDKKTAVLINWEGDKSSLLSPFKNLLRMPENKAIYNRNIYQLRANVQTFKKDSAKEFLINTCAKQAICIINPHTRQVAVLSNKDPSYMAAFFERYRNW